MLLLTNVGCLSLKSVGYLPAGFYAGSFIMWLALSYLTHTSLSGKHGRKRVEEGL
jgi:hypothetical protein